MSVSLIDGHIDDDVFEEVVANAEKCLAPFEVRDIIAQQQETINCQKAEIEKREQKICNLKEAVFRMIRYTDRLIEYEKLYDDETARYAFNKAREYFKEQVGEV